MKVHYTSRMKNEFYARIDGWYWARFWEIHGDNPGQTNKWCFYQLEEEFFEKYGCNRFTDYNSFRQGRYRHVQRGEKPLVVKEKKSTGPTLYDKIPD